MSILIGMSMARSKNLTPENVNERIAETADNILKGKIADVLENLLTSNNINLKISPDCRSAVALVEKLVGDSPAPQHLDQIPVWLKLA